MDRHQQWTVIRGWALSGLVMGLSVMGVGGGCHTPRTNVPPPVSYSDGQLPTIGIQGAPNGAQGQAPGGATNMNPYQAGDGRSMSPTGMQFGLPNNGVLDANAPGMTNPNLLPGTNGNAVAPNPDGLGANTYGNANGNGNPISGSPALPPLDNAVQPVGGSATIPSAITPPASSPSYGLPNTVNPGSK